MPRMRRTQWILFLLYIGAAAISFQYSDLKYRSLGFHTRDYAFYLQFASKLLDQDITKSYSLNPFGHNWLYFHGTEGVNHFHQSLHFEPVKYFYAVLYKVFNTPRILFLFTSLIFFLPLPYVAFTIHKYTKEQLPLLFLAVTLYLIYPSALMVPGYDLRPYIFLSPFFFLALLSIGISRPIWEKLVWFNAMFLGREEAIILGLVLIGYACFKIQEQPLRRSTVFSLVFSFIIWALIISAYFTWAGYPTDFIGMLSASLNPLTRSHAYKLIIVIAGVFSTIAAGILCWRWLGVRPSNPRYQWSLEFLSYGLVFLPLGYQFFKNELPEILLPLGGIAEALILPRYHLYFVAVLGLIVISLPYARKSLYYKTGLTLLTSLILFFLLFSLISPHGITRLYAKYQDESESASAVFDIRKVTDKLQSQVLTDYSTHQAFYDYQHVYVYNRLPWHVVPGENRFHPANQTVVQALVNDQIEYIVVSTNGFDTVRKYIVDSGLASRILFENDRFIAIQIVRNQPVDINSE